jgi:hypothetical protein
MYDCVPFFRSHTVDAWEEASPKSPSRIDINAELTIDDYNLHILHRYHYLNVLSTALFGSSAS